MAPNIPPPRYGEHITILSIDGGGVKGIVAGVILSKLEECLQKYDGPEARIADYFDLIGGTSTGGLITAMLTTPKKDSPKVPIFQAKDIVPFYKKHATGIFYDIDTWYYPKWARMLNGPLYDGKYLRKKLDELLGDTRLDQTLTNVIIPTFDIYSMQPVLFNSFKARGQGLRVNPQLAEVCKGSTAAPTFFPAYSFSTKDSYGAKHDYNLLDGAVAANNPTLTAMNLVIKEKIEGDTYFEGIDAFDYKKYIVISVGAGTTKGNELFKAKDVAKWGVAGWLTNGRGAPLIDSFMGGSTDLVEINLVTAFKALKCEENYLRVQTVLKNPKNDGINNSKEKNLKELEMIGQNLLNDPVYTLGSDYGWLAGPEKKTNNKALDEMAKKLSDERRARIAASTKK